ncbi:MAG TPA: CdaR family protein, partial [Synergistaceae bacterium]|nr:CdaR family protein [Synergistaceae bacterium]
ISDITEDVSRNLRVLPPPSEADIRMEPREVTVSLKVMPEMQEKTLRNVPLLVRGKSIYPQWEVFPSHVTVHLQGAARDLKKITSESLEAFVDVTNLVSRKISVPIRINSGIKGVTVLGTVPETATVYAKIDG